MSENTDSRIRPILFYKAILASMIVVVLVVIPISVIIPGWIQSNHISMVLLSEKCMDYSNQTLFVFCFLRTCACSLLLEKFVLPLIFKRTFLNKTEAITSINIKQRQIVSHCVKLIIKAYCLLQITILVIPQMSFEDGFLNKYNIGEAAIQLKENGTALTCIDAGMDMDEVISMRAWFFVRIDFMALMAWDMVFASNLHYLAIMHHLFAILGVTVVTEPVFIEDKAHMLPLIDVYSFGPFFMGPYGALLELSILLYHYNKMKPAKRLAWLLLNTFLQILGIVVLNICLPVDVMVKNFERFGTISCIFLIALLIFTVLVQFGMLFKKISILQHLKKKNSAHIKNKLTNI